MKAPLSPGIKIVTHRGRPLAMSGRSGDLPSDLLDHIVDYFEAQERGEGPASQMMRFAEPLLEAAGDDDERRERALTMATAFWNMAMSGEAERERIVTGFAEVTAKDEQDVAEFRALAADMIDRHKKLFPGMHRS